MKKRSARQNAGPHAVYRLFNMYDDLLYIGSTVDLKVRWKDHRKRMPWWYQVDHGRDQIEWMDCGPGDTKRREREAIRTELPWYNRSWIPVSWDESGVEIWPNLPPGCPPQPSYTHTPAAEYRAVWREWHVLFRELMLNPEERTALRRLTPDAGR